MSWTIFVLDYFGWHYNEGVRSFTANWRNFMWFIYHFFSISLLTRTLFSPWKRMVEQKHASDLEGFFEAIVFNILSRFFGAFVRLIIIGMGIAMLVLGLFAYVCALILWLILPLLLVFSFMYGLTNIRI